MRLPIDDTVVCQELAGKKVVLFDNQMHSSVATITGETVLSDDFTSSPGYGWEAVDGALRLMGKTGAASCEFRGMESKNAAIYLVGEELQTLSKNGKRVLLAESVPLSSRDWGVCISSHKDYEEHTLPPLLKSLKKSGFDMKRVVVVTAGYAFDDQETTEDANGVIHHKVETSIDGFTSLAECVSVADFDYWFLLHDTCEVTLDFSEKAMRLETALNPDIALLRPPEENFEIGLYSADFVSAMANTIRSSRSTDALKTLVSAAQVVTVAGHHMRPEAREKDVYGMGVVRSVLLIPSVGIKKFRGVARDGGKP